MPERPKGANYDLGNIEYRISQLESRAERNERIVEARRDTVDETLRGIERDHQAAIHRLEQSDNKTDKRVEIILVKLAIWATICGALGMLVMKAVLDKLVK